jgi:hypothetical protein
MQRNYKHDMHSLIFRVPYAQFINQLRTDLAALKVPPAEASKCGSHAFRHGAAKDILRSQGLQATLKRGGWRGRGVLHYTPRSEIESRLLSEMWEGLSEDEA